jgi:hypothetical protein
VKVFVRATTLLAVLVLCLDAYLLYGFYQEDAAIPEARAVKVANQQMVQQVANRDGGAGRDEAGYTERIGEIQAGSVDAFLDSNGKLLRYDNLKAEDVEELKANYLALRDYRRRADELSPPEEYEDQYESFDFALGDLHYAAELAYRLAADPISATQADFGAYALHVDRAEEHLRRSNGILGREFERIEGARTPTIG